MKHIRNDSTDPYYNLALEEYVLTTFRDGQYILLWQNYKAVVIGKHQNAAEEVNIKRAEELGVKIVRRNTGGGAVYHDLGNLNFSFITDWDPDKDMDYDTFLKPVIHALSKFELEAEKQGRNDLVIDGKKISGNAQCISNPAHTCLIPHSEFRIPNSNKGRILHHGTLLIDSELSVMPELLNVPPDKIVSKGIKSVRSRVANINDFTVKPLDSDLLKKAILESFFNGGDVIEKFLTGAQKKDVERLAKEKYETWEWNYGLSPAYSYKNAKRFPAGKVEVRLDVKNGIIENCKIYGDFLALVGVEDLETAVTGCRADINDLKRALEHFDLQRYYGITIDQLLECFV